MQLKLIQKRKQACQEMAKITKKNKNQYWRLRQAAKEAVARDMKEDAQKKINQLGRNPSNVFRVVRKMKIEKTDLVGGKCERGSVRTHYIIEKDTAKLCKELIKKIMNKENG